MEIIGIDHIVITTQDLAACLHFYGDVLGMQVVHGNGRYAVTFGQHKFNIHTRKAEFLPAAANPTYGSLDLCLEVGGKLAEVKKEIDASGYPIEEGPVTRHGARGEMTSLYLRDPDGNLFELCSYDSVK
ncbi:VOC family protein [Lactobacillus delbrueckii]|uniref:VOC family protein n=1 Tax=Lactobacillus delbrueckii TaxID=1584 RepID=UPI0039955599